MSGESATESVIPWGESCPRELGVCQVPAGSLRCKSPRAQAAGAARLAGFTARAMYNVHKADVCTCSFVTVQPWKALQGDAAFRVQVSSGGAGAGGGGALAMVGRDWLR